MVSFIQYCFYFGVKPNITHSLLDLGPVFHQIQMNISCTLKAPHLSAYHVPSCYTVGVATYSA